MKLKIVYLASFMGLISGLSGATALNLVVNDHCENLSDCWQNGNTFEQGTAVVFPTSSGLLIALACSIIYLRDSEGEGEPGE